VRVRTEIGLAIGALLCVQVATSFGSIALLSRMSPAIARIMEENLYSLEAVEGMVVALSLAELDREGATREFEAALGRARSNVTEPEEPQILTAVVQRYRAALAGDPEARRATVKQLRELARINHASTRRADAAAQRMGMAGAWAAGLLGVVGFIFSGLAISRLTRNVLRPLTDIGETVAAFRDGDLHRRSRRTNVPVEFRDVATALDDLLDVRQAQAARDEVAAAEGRPVLDPREVERRALLHLLSRQETPTLVIAAGGRVLAAGADALALLDHSERSARLMDLVKQGSHDGGAARDVLAWTDLGGSGFLCAVTDPGAITEPTPSAPASTARGIGGGTEPGIGEEPEEPRS